METNSQDVVNASVHNKKNAVIAMCKVSVLLLVVTGLSAFSGYALLSLVEKYSVAVQGFISSALEFFGAAPQDAYVTSRIVLSSEAFSNVLSMAVTVISLAIPAIVFAKLVNVTPRESFNLGGKLVKYIIPVFCFCNLVTTFVSVFAGGISDFLVPESSVYYEGTGVVAHEFNVYSFVISVLCTCIFVPIVEEFVFRGVAFSYLSRYGIGFGAVASAVLFGLAHASPVQSLYAFVFGLVSALMMAVTGNIKTSILLHAGNNLITVLLGYLMGETSEMTFGIISGIYMLVFSAMGIYGIYCLCKSDGILQSFRKKEEENDGNLAEKPGMKEIFVFPLVVYLVYFVYSFLITVM